MKNSYCDPSVEDFPINLYEEEDFEFRLSSSCCGAETYKDSDGIICLNCTERCNVIEDVVVK